MGRKIFGVALSFFFATWLVSSAINYLERMIVPLLIIGALVLAGVIIFRVLNRNRRW